MLATFHSAWTLVVLSAFIVVPPCLPAPTSQRQDDSQTAAAAADDHAAHADNPPLVRTKRADEVIFNAQSGEASRVKKSDGDAAEEQTPPRAVGDDVTGGNDEKKPASDVGQTSLSSSSAAAADSVMTETEADGQNDDNNNGQQQDDAEPVSDAVATSSDDSENDADEAADAGDDDDDDGGDDSKDSSLMLAENMEAQRQEQKFRAKRDLDADEIRELFESQNARQDDNYVPEYSYDVDEYDEYAPRLSQFSDDDDADPWQYDDFYDVEGRPKRDDDDLYQYQSDVDREAVRELLAERAAEETRQALLEYLTAGEPSYSVDEPQYVVEPIEDEDEEYSDLLDDDEQPGVYDEEPELTEKRSYPYSYEPYGGRWGALVPGAKRSDRDPYDRLYRLADLLSRPAQLGSDVGDYEKK